MRLPRRRLWREDCFPPFDFFPDTDNGAEVDRGGGTAAETGSTGRVSSL